MTYQDMLLSLLSFWGEHGCVIGQPYSGEVGAGTNNPLTLLRCLGPEPWRCAYVEPSKRPADSRRGENPNRVYGYNQLQVVLKPPPADIQDLYLESLRRVGLDTGVHDIRFVEDDWEQPSLGAAGLGWEVWCDGMEITQFTYFQQLASMDVEVVTGEITYGTERVAMYVQDVDSMFDLEYAPGIRYGEIYLQGEREWSTYALERADTGKLFAWFDEHEAESTRLLGEGLILPAYDFALRASHTFNLLDARGAISVGERARYLARVRELARSCGTAYLAQREALGFPLLKQPVAAG